MNRFIADPVKIVILDPINLTNLRSYVLLGDVPAAIARACREYATATSKQRADFDKILRQFYGPQYMRKLGLGAKDVSKLWISPPQYPKIITGAGPGRDDEVDLDELEELMSAQDDLSLPVEAGVAPAPRVMVTAQTSYVHPTPGVEYNTSVHVYPEDRLNELKEKIYLATDIPAYRQHLFHINHGRYRSTYIMQVEGHYNTDIRQISTYKDTIHGVPVDKTLYDMREYIKVDALDQFILAGDALVDSIVYVVDIAYFTSRMQTQLIEIINDTYQFELLYYGFVIKYWPQFSPETFRDYVISEADLQHKYPDFAKPLSDLQTTYKLEREIIDEHYRLLDRAKSRIDSGEVTLAITQVTATTDSGKSQLNIRNLFDKLRVSAQIPEIHAYIEHENRRYLLRKRYARNASDIQFPPGNLMKSGITLAISLRKADQESFHSRVVPRKDEGHRYLFLNLQPDGRYYIRTAWNEEDELMFDDVMKIMKRFTDPVITCINNLGKYVFVNNRPLPLLTKDNVTYQSLNVCVFWKRVMLASAFRALRGLFEPYIRARIMAQRQQQQDRSEYIFRKGMHEFDIDAIDRIVTASTGVLLANQYTYLSNNTIKQKWEQSYDGRIFRLSHRTTDIKFEIADIHENEFQIFHDHILTFIHKAANKPEIRSLLHNRPVANVKKLRKLREQDPELFNLKKHGSKKVYSKICQNKRQPLIYTDAEIKNLPANERKKLTEYWNFTLNKPAYYACPDRAYPHLGFMVGIHPRGYCLPCCNKKPQRHDNKKMQITALCLKHKIITDVPEQTSSRHVMSYGKDLEPGRLAKLPPDINTLLFEPPANGKSTNYYLFGVPQQVPAAEHVGAIFAIAEALETPPSELIRRLAAELKKTPSAFSTLLNGTIIEYFASLDDLVASMYSVFVMPSAPTLETQRFEAWPELVVELLRMLGVDVFLFIDDRGNGQNVELFVSGPLLSELVYLQSLNKKLAAELTSNKTYVVLLKRQNVVYPIFAIDTAEYFRTLAVNRRRFYYEDPIVATLRHVAAYGVRHDSNTAGRQIDLVFVENFAKKSYTIIKKFINKQNLCYAVLLAPSASSAESKSMIYVPVDYSVHISDGIPITFEPFIRSDYDLPADLLAKCVEDINAFIKLRYVRGGTYIYTPISIEKAIKHNDKYIGFTSGSLYFYHNASAKAISTASTATPLEQMYDYGQVNDMILKRAGPTPDPRVERLGESLYTNHLYQLYVLEFANYLSRERNEAIRKQIRDLIESTDFRKDTDGLRKELREILKDYPADLKKINDQLRWLYHIRFDKPRLYSLMEDTVYEFDRTILNKLKRLDGQELVDSLVELSSEFCIQRDIDTTKIQFPNIFVPCTDSKDNTGICEKRKLIVNRPITDLAELLAADLKNDLKSRYIFESLYTDTIVNYFHFDRYPDEIITIYKLSE